MRTGPTARCHAGLAALRLATAALGSSLVLSAPLASAQPALAEPAPASAASVVTSPERYKQHMDNGVRLYADKNYRAAIAEFQAAYVAQPKASPLVNLALCHKAEFRYPKAIAALEKALTEHADTMEEADRKAALQGIDEMKALLAHVRVTLVPADAALSVDGDPVPAAEVAKPIAVGPGAHTFAATRSGYQGVSQQLSVVSGDDKALTLALPRSAGRPAPAEEGERDTGGRKSTALMVLGIVSGSLGLAAALTGVSVMVFDGAGCPENDPEAPLCDDGKRIGTGVVLTVAGGALLAAGIPMFIVGASPKRAEGPARASLRPEIRVAPTAAALRWRF